MHANRFAFDATTSLRGAFPMPPTLSAGAAEVLNDWLTHAFWASPSLHQRNHKKHCVPTAELEGFCNEILRTNFPMPCEWHDEPIPVIDRISMFPMGIEFTISELFAAYLLSSAQVIAITAAWAPTSPYKAALPLSDQDLPIVVAALQTHHHQHSIAWNAHAIYASSKGGLPQPREAFGLPEIERVLSKLGASSAP